MKTMACLVVWRRCSFWVGALCVLVLAGCSDSADSTKYGATSVQDSLRAHRFDVAVIFDRREGSEPDDTVLGLLNLFDDVEDVEALVADRSPNGGIGGEISAWVFDTEDRADAFQTGAAFRLQRDNVVVLTDDKHEAAARDALDELR